jgi:hypothetical protein
VPFSLSMYRSAKSVRGSPSMAGMDSGRRGAWRKQPVAMVATRPSEITCRIAKTISKNQAQPARSLPPKGGRLARPHAYQAASYEHELGSELRTRLPFTTILLSISRIQEHLANFREHFAHLNGHQERSTRCRFTSEGTLP